MSSTAKCIEMLVAEMDGGLSASFNKLIKGDKISWKRFSKFHYRDGVRRYFYLIESALIATVDERNPTPEEVVELNKQLEKMKGISPEEIKVILKSKIVKIIIRPPMKWEHIMLQDARPDDVWVHEHLGEICEEYYEFCAIESAKGSEPQQYTFKVGPQDGGRVFFSPIKCEHYDEHLANDLDPILPDWLVKSGEVIECTYGIDEHSLWTMGCLDNALESIKKELIELGFTEQVNKC